jgi:hypothetical protein
LVPVDLWLELKTGTKDVGLERYQRSGDNW